MTAKLHFFALIASILKPFLVVFQSDNPMLPFLCDELSNVSKRLIALMYKKESHERRLVEKQKQSNGGVFN